MNVTKQDVVAAMLGEWQQAAGAASQAAQVFAVAENFKMKACLSSRIAGLAQCLFAWQQLAGFKGIPYRRLQVGQMLIDGKEHYVAIRPGTDFGFMAHHHAAGAIQTEAGDGRVRLRHEFTGAAITKMDDIAAGNGAYGIGFTAAVEQYMDAAMPFEARAQWVTAYAWIGQDAGEPVSIALLLLAMV
ncbi:hypothetical protein [Aquitalea sp. ASV11]|uniref:hypothetical protein n=1 Tax=Aquitalea sp. ASV11 TaxID=2795103 RepID=UPI0018EB5E7F|nr:hypothetical protein [Aquitalea sp. ASV11]